MEGVAFRLSYLREPGPWRPEWDENLSRGFYIIQRSAQQLREPRFGDPHDI
jgi:hypothetical protein